MINNIKLANGSAVPDRQPVGAIAAGVDLVIIRWDDSVDDFRQFAATVPKTTGENLD